MADADRETGAERGTSADEGSSGAERGPTGTAETTGKAERAGTGPSETPMTQQVGRVVVAILAVVFLIFAIANQEPVPFNYLFGTGEVALIVLLLASFVLGAALGATVTWRRNRRRRGSSREGRGG
jgi:uncharacterized integral membrane protein